MTTDTTQQNHSEYSEWTAGYLASQTEKYDRFGVGRLYIDITGHLTDGIIFSRLMYWFTPSKKGNPRTKVSRDGHRWVARNYDQWWEECRVDERTARASVKRMVDSGLLIKAVFKFGKKPTTHLRINWQTFEKLAKEHLAISLEDKRSLKRSKRQKMTERTKSVVAKNDGTMVVAKNDGTKFRQKMSEPSSMITESLTTTQITSLQPAAGASVAGAPEVAAKAVVPDTKQESSEPVKDKALTNRKNLPKPKAAKEQKPPDPVFRWVCDYLGVNPDVAWHSSKHEAWGMRGYIIAEEKGRLKQTTPLSDDQLADAAKALPGFPVWYDKECKDCSLPRYRRFQTWIGKWYLAGRPGKENNNKWTYDPMTGQWREPTHGQ